LEVPGPVLVEAEAPPTGTSGPNLEESYSSQPEPKPSVFALTRVVVSLSMVMISQLGEQDLLNAFLESQLALNQM